MRFCYSRDVTNVQKRRNECSRVLVDRTNSPRDETGCFWRDMCVCVWREVTTRVRWYSRAFVCSVEKALKIFEFSASMCCLGFWDAVKQPALASKEREREIYDKKVSATA